MKTIRVGFVVWVGIVSLACAQEPPRKLTLGEALQTALKQHPSLTRAEYQTAAAEARVQQARAGTTPTLTIQGSASDGPTGATAFGVQGLAGDPIKRHYGASLNIVQSLYDFGRTQHLVTARRLLVQAIEEDAETQKSLVLLSVQRAYLDVLRHQQLVAVQLDNVRQRETTVRQAQAFADSGLKSGVDLRLAQANLFDARVGLIAAQNEVRVAFAGLNNAMGATSLTAYQLDAQAAVACAMPMLEELTKHALEQRPELRGTTLQLDAAGQSIKAARSGLMPRFDAIASVGRINPSGLIANNKSLAVGLVVTLPLFTGGAVEGQIVEEKQKREAVLAWQRELTEAVKLQVTRAWLNAQTREEQVKAAQEQVAAANESLRLASERYRLQLNTIVELTEAEVAVTKARTQLVNATYDLELARAELDWATGETYRKYARVVKR